MLNVALVGLLAGSLVLGPADGDDDKKKKAADDQAAVENATPGVFETARAQRAEPITQDTYMLGRPSGVPIKLWASYAYGQADRIFAPNGNEAELSVATSEGDITSQRINVGAEVNPISLDMFSIGAGALLTIAQNEFFVEPSGSNSSFVNGVGDLSSGFGPQGLKVYGSARGKVVGIHGGYIFDFGDSREFETEAIVDFSGAPNPQVAAFGQAPASINSDAPAGQEVLPTGLVTLAGLQGYQQIYLPTALSNSDGRDAIVGGIDFDYPSERFRLFGGIDYFALQGIADEPRTEFDESTLDGDDLINFLFGGGVRLGIAEVGAALQIQTRLSNPTVDNIGTTEGVGGHIGTIAPYLRISPPSIPASLFIKGAVQEEYTEYGLAIGGANSVKPEIGFTAGLSIGFE